MIEKVDVGFPVAQQYGLGAPWTNDTHRWFNRSSLCGGYDSPCMSVTDTYGDNHYNVGPPYIVIKQDLIRLSDTWNTFVPRVYSKYPHLLAEMYAYSMAAAHEELPHLQMFNYMISSAVAGSEGWSHIDHLHDVCMPPNNHNVFFPDKPLPTFLHYCQGMHT